MLISPLLHQHILIFNRYCLVSSARPSRHEELFRTTPGVRSLYRFLFIFSSVHLSTCPSILFYFLPSLRPRLRSLLLFSFVTTPPSVMRAHVFTSGSPSLPLSAFFESFFSMFPFVVIARLFRLSSELSIYVGESNFVLFCCSTN